MLLYITGVTSKQQTDFASFPIVIPSCYLTLFSIAISHGIVCERYPGDDVAEQTGLGYIDHQEIKERNHATSLSSILSTLSFFFFSISSGFLLSYLFDISLLFLFNHLHFLFHFLSFSISFSTFLSLGGETRRSGTIVIDEKRRIYILYRDIHSSSRSVNSSCIL